MHQKEYDYGIPRARGFFLLLIVGVLLVFALAQLSGAQHENFQNLFTRYLLIGLYLAAWCYYIAGLVGGFIYKPKVLIAGDIIRIPLPPTYKETSVSYNNIDSIQAIKESYSFYTSSGPYLIIRSENRKYPISKWRFNSMNERPFLECVNFILENIQQNRPDLVEDCNKVRDTLPKLNQPLPPPYKPSKLFLFLFVILLSPVVLLILFILFEFGKRWFS